MFNYSLNIYISNMIRVTPQISTITATLLNRFQVFSKLYFLDFDLIKIFKFFEIIFFYSFVYWIVCFLASGFYLWNKNCIRRYKSTASVLRPLICFCFEVPLYISWGNNNFFQKDMKPSSLFCSNVCSVNTSRKIL